MSKCTLCQINKVTKQYNGDDVCDTCYDGLCAIKNKNENKKYGTIHKNFRSSINRIFNINNDKKIKGR